MAPGKMIFTSDAIQRLHLEAMMAVKCNRHHFHHFGIRDFHNFEFRDFHDFWIRDGFTFKWRALMINALNQSFLCSCQLFPPNCYAVNYFQYYYKNTVSFKI